MTHVNKCEHILWSCVWWAFLRDFFIRFCWLFVWCLAIVLILLLFELTLSLLFTRSPPLLLYFACKVEQIINLIFISYPIGLTFTAERIPSLLSNIGISFLHLFIFTFSLLVISLFLIFFLFIFWKIPYPVKITGPSHTFSIVPWGSLLLNLLLWLIVFLFLLFCSSILLAWDGLVVVGIVRVSLWFLIIGPKTLRIPLLLLCVLCMLPRVYHISSILLTNHKRVIWQRAGWGEPQVLPGSSHLAH